MEGDEGTEWDEECARALEENAQFRYSAFMSRACSEDFCGCREWIEEMPPLYGRIQVQKLSLMISLMFPGLAEDGHTR